MFLLVYDSHANVRNSDSYVSNMEVMVPRAAQQSLLCL